MAERPPSIEERISAALAPADESPAPEAPPEQPAQSAPQEVDNDGWEVDQEAEAEADAEEAAAEQGGGSTEADGPVEYEPFYPTDLAEQLNVPIDVIYENFTLPVTGPDGQRVNMKLSDVKDSVQAVEQAKKYAQEQKNLRDTLQSQQQALAEFAERQHHEVSSLMALAEQQLLAEYNSVNWDSLRQQNPVEWAAKRQEFAERNGHLQRAKFEAAQTYEQRKMEHAQFMQNNIQEHLARNHARMDEAFPKWKTDKALETAEQALIRSELLKHGYTPEDIDNCIDARPLIMAYKSAKYDELMSKSDVAKKKLVKLSGTVLKPGAKASKAQAQQDIESTLKAKLRKTGRHEDAAELIRLRLGR